MPFVQGRLRGERLSGVVTTKCAHSQEPLHIEVDSDLNCRVVETGAAPLMFAPLVVVRKGAPSIIEGF